LEGFFENIEFLIEQPGQGKILISEPFLPDPNFNRSVVLLTEHNNEGSVGFVLNRPSDMLINDVIEDFPSFDATVFMGGPVGLDQLFYIHTLGDLLEHSVEIMPGLWWGGDFDQLKLLVDTNQVQDHQVRFFAGYSGWSPGQLKGEIEEKSWIVAKIDREQVLKDSKSYWEDVMQGLGEKFKVMSRFPEDPSLN
tara:strand:+ start:145 stop:726 length:582 start_codon:yes stop_codon:yes gene_type:complete